jgi:hypothetical protein
MHVRFASAEVAGGDPARAEDSSSLHRGWGFIVLDGVRGPHSNRVEGQAGAGEKLQGTPSRIMALRIVSSFRMAATSATRLGRPLATSRL